MNISKKRCNRIELIHILPEKRDESGLALICSLSPFIKSEKNVLEWMGKIYYPNNDHEYSIKMDIEVSDESVIELQKYKELFTENSEFDISFFNNEKCYFYANKDQLFAYNKYLMADFIKENNIKE